MLHPKTIAPLVCAAIVTLCNAPTGYAQRIEVPATGEAGRTPRPLPTEVRAEASPLGTGRELTMYDPAVAPAQYVIQAEPTIFGDFEAFASQRVRDLNVRQTRLPKVWEFSAGAIFWNREVGDSPLVRANDTSPNSRSLLGTEEFNDRQTGYYLAARGERMELRYFGVDSISSQLTAPAGTIGVRPVNGATLEYQSSLTSVEANVYFFQSTNVRLLAGFRNVNLDEEININGVSAVSTENDLYGVQIGADTLAYLFLDGRAALRTGAKAGVYHVHSDVENFTNAAPTFDASDSIAFVGEYYLSIHYQLYRWLEFDIGYHVLWLNGVALPGEQISDPQAAPVVGTDHGSTLFHGLKLGLTANW